MIHIVAPRRERSACSHAITTGRPITVERIKHDRLGTIHAVDGTPADCVRLAIGVLFNEPFDLVVSGVNHGANAGVDLFYSGTIAAAREGTALGISAIAVSQAVRAGVETAWLETTEATAFLVRELSAEKLPGAGFWSINLPAPIPPNPRNHVHRVPPAIHPAPLAFDRAERDDRSATEFTYGAPYWRRDVTEPSDYSVVRDGDIAVTAIPLFGRF